MLPWLFQVEGKPWIWHKDVYEGGEFKLIKTNLKIDVRRISGQIFLFCLVKMQNNVKFCEVYNLSHTIGKTTGKRMIHFQILQGLSMKRNFICKFDFFGKFCFFLKVFSIVLLISWIWNVKISHLVFLQENINLISSSLQCIVVPIFILSSNLERF